jgi:hypothetical protein
VKETLSFLADAASVGEKQILGLILGNLYAGGITYKPPTMQADSWQALKVRYKRKSGKGKKNDASKWLFSGLDEDFEEAFPFRTKKDAHLRLFRSNDIYDFIRGHAKCKECNIRIGCSDLYLYLCEMISKIRGEFDYITTLSILTYGLGENGRQWFKRKEEIGALDDGFENFASVTKDLSNKVKTSNWTTPDSYKEMEAQTLVGYRVLPYPGFDIVEEAKDLASGNVVPQILFAKWSELADVALKMEPEYMEFITYEDYIFLEPDDWVTSGAGAGYAYFEFDKDEVKVKCRKNMMFDALSRDEILELAYDFRQNNIVAIKEEGSKIRPILSVPPGPFWLQKYLIRISGKVYLQWEGNALQLDFNEQTAMYAEMVKNAQSSFGVPLDFARFDHQIFVWQMADICHRVFIMGSSNVPSWYKPTWLRLVSKAVTSFYDATITVTKQLAESSSGIKLTSNLVLRMFALSSGILTTSIIGNGFNAIMAQNARVALSTFNLQDELLKNNFLGDDAAFWAKTYRTAALLILIYIASKLDLGEGKFSIQKGRVEFLRIWFTGVGTYGIPVRAFHLQRKPWSNEPNSPFTVPGTIISMMNTLKRRGWDMGHLQTSLLTSWARFKKVPFKALMVPTALGGIGLLPWDGSVRVKGLIPKPTLKGVVFKNLQPWRFNKLTELSREAKIEVTNLDLNRIAHSQAVDLLSVDNVPKAASYLKKLFQDELRTITIYETIPPQLVPLFVPHFVMVETDSSALVTRLQMSSGSFGKYVSNINFLMKIKPILQYSTSSMMDWIREHDLALNQAIAKLRLPIAEALDWLSGNVSVPETALHPELVYVGKLVLAGQGSPAGKLSTLYRFSILGPIVFEQLRRSNIAKLYYNY